MQQVRIRSLSVALITVGAITASFGQSVSYLDKDYRPASERSYAFKRVIKFNKEHLSPYTTTDKFGRRRTDFTESGLYVCLLVDYFPDGTPALEANVITLKENCTEWSFDGKVTYFYRSGQIRKTEYYLYTKLQGDVITYAEDRRIVAREHYENGQLIDDKKYPVAANHPLVGKWKYVKYVDWHCTVGSCIEFMLRWTFSWNGILHSQASGYENWETQTNWKYTSTGAGTGVLEEFQGETLAERGDVRWISKNEFEDTVTFSPNPNSIGHRWRFVRE